MEHRQFGDIIVLHPRPATIDASKRPGQLFGGNINFEAVARVGSAVQGEFEAPVERGLPVKPQTGFRHEEFARINGDVVTPASAEGEMLSE